MSPVMNTSPDELFFDIMWIFSCSTILFVLNCFSSGGRFSSFSPCIEQVQKTHEALKALGFVETRTIECLQREYQVQYRNFPVLDLDVKSVVSVLSFPHAGCTCLLVVEIWVTYGKQAKVHEGVSASVTALKIYSSRQLTQVIYYSE